MSGLRVGQPRAIGALELSAKATPRGSKIDALRQTGALRALFPRPRGDALEAIVINTAGGATGGDRFAVRGAAGPGARLSLTTQAAERAYRAGPGERAAIHTRLQVANGGRLDWLPQETILFEGCALDRRIEADLAEGGRLLLAEPLIFGRAAMGERLRAISFRDRIILRRDRRVIFLDAARFEGDAEAHLAARWTAQGASAAALVILVAPEAEGLLATLRALLPPGGGASLLAPDILVMRMLAADGHLLRRYLVPALAHLAGTDLPRSWMT